jgi:hypothetical protein
LPLVNLSQGGSLWQSGNVLPGWLNSSGKSDLVEDSLVVFETGPIRIREIRGV